MDFGLSAEQELLIESARDFLARECPPNVVRQAAGDPTGVSQALEREIADMGWTGLLVPESHGGLGLGMLDMGLLLREFGRFAVPGPFFFSAVLGTAAILKAGDSRQKRRWLPKLARGETSIALALLEESDRLGSAGIQARARRSRSGFRLNAKKFFVPYAHVADAIITACRTAAGDGACGITLFLVERSAPGVHVTLLDSFDRTRRVCKVEMRDVEVAPENVLGREGGGWPALARVLDLAAVGLAADGLGGSERVLEMAVAYAKTREQFGRPIASFQAVKHMAAEMVAEVEPARSLLWYAAHAQDAIPRDASRAASMAKASLCDIYSRASNRAVQMHGGIGFTWEHDIHFWFKRAKWNEAAFGDPAHHREHVAELTLGPPT